MAADTSGHLFVTAATQNSLGTQIGIPGSYWDEYSALAASVNSDGSMVIAPGALPVPTPTPWPIQIGKTGATTKALNVFQETATDMLEYMGGNFEAGLTTASTLGGSSGHNLLAHGAQDAYLSCFGAPGVLNWVYQYGAGGATTTTGRSVFEDPDGEDYDVVGDTNGTFPASFGPPVNPGTQDMYIGQLNFSGYFKWLYQLGAGPGSHVTGNGLVAVNSNSFFVTGQTDASLGGSLQGTRGTTDAYIAVYAWSGFQLAAELGGGAGTTSVGQALTTNWLHGVNLVGTTSGTVGSQSGTHGTNDVFVAGYDGSGNFLWATQLGVAGANTQGNSILFYSGELYVVGTTSGSLGGSQYGTHGNNDLFVAHFDSTGNFKWVSQLGVAGGNTYGQGLSLDNAGALYVTGYTDGVIPGGTQSGTHGVQDALVAQFDTSGNFNWVAQLGASGATTNALGISYVYANNSQSALAVTPSSGIVTGFTSGQLGGTQLGTHGLFDQFIFRTNSTGILP